MIVAGTVLRLHKFYTSHLTGALGFAKDDPRFGHVVGGYLHFHSVAWHNANEILAHLAANMSQNFLAVWQIHAEHCVGKYLRHDALRHKRFFFRHRPNLPNNFQIFKRIARKFMRGTSLVCVSDKGQYTAALNTALTYSKCKRPNLSGT